MFAKGVYDAVRNHLNSLLVPLDHLCAPVFHQAIKKDCLLSIQLSHVTF